MNDDSKYRSQVSRYLKLEMTGRERDLFEKELETNNDLLEELQLQQMETVAEKVLLRDAVSGMISGFENKRKAQENLKKKKHRKVTIGVIFSIIVLMILGYYLLIDRTGAPTKTLQTPRSIAQIVFYETLPPNIDARSGYKGSTPSQEVSQKEKTLQNALILLRKNKIEESIDSLKLTLPYDQSIFYLGHAYFMAEDFNSSIEVLQEIRNDKVYGERATFLLALSYLAIGNNKQYYSIENQLKDSRFNQSLERTNQMLKKLEEK